MKKVITLCLFAFAMLIGSQTLVAQSSKLEIQKEINAEASTKTEALRKQLKFGDDQRDEIYNALKTYGQGKVALAASATTNKEDELKLEKQLDDKVKSVLSDEQYAQYKLIVAEN